MHLEPAIAPYSKDHPFPARLTENRQLSKPGSSKDTRHFVINLAGSGLTYKAGDSLAVFSTNRPDLVEEILQRLNATGDELVSPAMLRLTAPISLREALFSRLALAGPTKKIIETLAGKVTDAEERTKLAALLAPEAKEQLGQFLYEREYVDLLAEFPSARLTPQELVDHLRKLMPRLYSVASSGKVFRDEVHLTVAIVRYETNGRKRAGVCSSFMADRVVANQTPVPVFVSHSHFTVPDDGSKDIIMVGPGTGVAPFRAFLQERVATGATGRNWLFFGDQKRATDFIYEEEWNAWQQQGHLARFDVAFSRDQREKIYVQDRMRAAGADLWAWLQSGAHFYVCGDAKRMAKDVDVALHGIVALHGKMDGPAAVDYVKRLKKEHRYLRDVY